eukprot:712597-Pyramimonas_sp.AAC.1
MLSESGAPDSFFERFEDLVSTVGHQLFSRAHRAPGPQVAKRRRQLLADRLKLKEQRAEVENQEELERIEEELKSWSAALLQDRRKARKEERQVYVEETGVA